MTMARSVSVSELKAQLSKYLRLVRQGEVVLVRDRNRVVARVEGAGPTSLRDDDARLGRLEEAGVIRRRSRTTDPALLARRVRARGKVLEALLAERDEGR
jgi:prevent-host-death family protein